jgi:NAD(P)-dependent dehydrogenase (short-subunit alcohol dehydrogenase family)
MTVIAVLGVGPGLGLSIARRWAAEGYTVAMVSRSPARHDTYLGALPPGGHRAYPADVTDPVALGRVLTRIRRDLGSIDAVYFGPAAAGRQGIVPLAEAGAEALREPIELLLMPLLDRTRCRSGRSGPRGDPGVDRQPAWRRSSR